MNLTFEIYLLIALLLLYIDVLIIFKIIVNRLKNADKKERFLKNERNFIATFSQTTQGKQIGEFSENYKQLKESMLINHIENERVENPAYVKKNERKNINRLASISKLKRMEGAVNLGYIASDQAQVALEKALKREKNTPVKIYIANALADIGKPQSIPVIVSTLINSHRWYRSRINKLLMNFGENFNHYLPEIIESKDIEIKEVIVDFASVYFSSQLKNYLRNVLEETLIGNPSAQDKNLVYNAAEVLAAYYPEVMLNEKYLNSEDVKIKNSAVKALSKGDPFESLNNLMSILSDQEVVTNVVDCILNIVDNNPELMPKVIDRFKNEKDAHVRNHLSYVFSSKIEYFVMKLLSREKELPRDIIEQTLILGRTSDIIDFMNKNKNIDIENELIEIIGKIVFNRNTVLEKDLCQYLNERILVKCGLTQCEEVPLEKIQAKSRNVLGFVYTSTFFVLLIFPIVFIVRYSSSILKLPYLRQLGIYVVDFNYYISFYAIAINLVYLILIALSLINVRRQSKLWKLKSYLFLFKERILPGISVIAPAHNEEKTIVESANSLLNLIYPDYELIIVNDGSVDKTMDVLIKAFELKRVSFKHDGKLNTRYIRGVYRSLSRPKLLVIDKVNGGKADSLNAAINQSNKEYFCGIDADSILEPDALLKLASREIDSGLETPALGGNIFPGNGCIIKNGSILNKNLPKNALPRFQTIEYIRAFMAGRLGWAFVNCLLIISGAFGLFRKERVVDVGGYLSVSGEYETHTVGEDMELVVRIGRMMREKKLKYKIDYVYNANCWTEVPEDLKSLRTQRYRWHRGLIEILAFHRKMILNPYYGRSGLVAMPYFFLFEFIGPLIEIQGYLMVLLAMILGLMNIQIIMLLFISIILLGTLVSLSSLLIAKNELDYFRGKDIAVLILYSVVENFGIRQMIGIWRFLATIRLLWRQEGWGKAERKGFETVNGIPMEVKE